MKLIEDFALALCSLINMIIPKKSNQIFFYSSPDYSDNARALYEEMKNSGLDKSYCVVWAVKDLDRFKPLLKNVTVVKHRSLRNLWHYCRSKYIVRTHSLWGNRCVVDRQVMCIAWHGMPLKKLARVNESVKPVKCDYLLSTSPVFDEELSSSMGLPTTVCVHTGLPRNDELFHGKNELESLYPGFSKRIIWMPTFRQGAGYQDGLIPELGIPCVSKDDVGKLNDYLKLNNYLLIVKLHPWAAAQYGRLAYSNIVELRDADLPNDLSLYRLIGQTDALITDYSSVYIDYLLCDKPICFAFNDLSEYAQTRGLVFEPVFDYMPGEKVSDLSGLISWIDSLRQDDGYRDERARLRGLFHSNNDSSSSQRVLQIMGLL